MAKILNGHFGSYQGKLGAVTGFKRKGIFYIRQSITHNGSNTKAQAEQRLLFAKVSAVLSKFAAAAKIGYPNAEAGLTGLNAFVKHNFGFVDSTGTLEVEKLMVARGSGYNVAAPGVSNSDPGVLTCSWTDESGTNPRMNAQDQVYVVAYEKESNSVTVQMGKRADTKLNFGYPRNWANKEAQVWVFTVSTQGKVSDSVYVGNVNCE